MAVSAAYLVIDDGSSKQRLVYAKGSLVRHTEHEVRVCPCCKTGLHSDWSALDVTEALGPLTGDSALEACMFAKKIQATVHVETNPSLFQM